ncbi:GNAT family N-acetyltransferase [uncultured Jatrophihabitans sp.]|uniref:GNAT family N-acetyltransferase n=1 Tax=uncultured Jatrophihabitans sp. TaxID=1610747 RepID=UPI0035C983DE
MAAGAHISVRPRRDADLPVLLTMLQRTHEREGYPVRASAVRADWLAAPRELAGLVAEHDRRVIGHIALHPTAVPGNDAGEDAAAVQWQHATGVAVGRLAVLSRFVTDRSVPGNGTTLLAHAVRAAADIDRVPVLLVDPDSAARDFYLRRGWREVGAARQQWGPRSVDAVLMIAGA